MTTDGSHIELRVHGVAATPPASILGLKAVPTDPEPGECGKVLGKVQIYDPAEVAPGVRGFSWSSLTSGSKRSAFWILLLPFMLANVAGWAMLPLASLRASDEAPVVEVRPPGFRWITLFVRLAGMLVTAIYVVGAALTFLDVAGYQWLALQREMRHGPALGLAVAAATLGFMFWRTRVRPRDDAPHRWREDLDDPVGYAWLDRDQGEMWNSPGIITRLHRLHMAFAFGLLALLASWSLTEIAGDTTADTALTIGAAGATLLAVALLAVVSLSKGRDLAALTPWIRYVAPAAGILATGLAIARFAAVDLTDEDMVYLPMIRGTGAWLAGAFVLLVGAAGFLAFALRDGDDRRTPPLSGFNLPALLLTAATVAAIFVVGLAVQASRMIGERSCGEEAVDGCKPEVGSVVDWVSAGFTLMLAALVVALLVIFGRAWFATPSGEARIMRTVSYVTRNVSVILTVLTVIGVVCVGLSLLIGVPGGFGEFHVQPWATTSAVAVLLAAAAAALVAKLRLVGAVIVAGATVYFLVTNKPIQVADVALPPGDFLAFANTLALTLPLGFVVGKMIGGFRERKTRETVAIAWDLGNFWPRWFHPLAPPTYADVAVTELKKAVDERLTRGETVLLAPHSQGSIISAASVAASDAPTERLAYLTYGSPLSRLYAQAFPAVFTRELFGQLCNRLSSSRGIKWRNLYRPTDPIGAPVAATPPGAPAMWPDPPPPIDVCVEATCGQTHSDYPMEDEYKAARAELLGMI